MSTRAEVFRAYVGQRTAVFATEELARDWIARTVAELAAEGIIAGATGWSLGPMPIGEHGTRGE